MKNQEKNKYKTTIIIILVTLSLAFILNNITIVSADVGDNTCPDVLSISITNQSIDVKLDVGYWNVSIYDDDGNTTSGSIQCSNGLGISWSDEENGTRSLSLPTLSWDTNYTVWLNFTDDICDVNNTYWFISEDLDTSVNSISPYWIEDVPDVNIRATQNNITAYNYTVDNITLYYRYSTDNSSWDDWKIWDGINNPSNNTGFWAWSFNCPNGSGFYEFYSIGVNNSNYEIPLGVADAKCHVNYVNWIRFGYHHVGIWSDELYDVLEGSNYTCPTTGIADNMTLWIENFHANGNVSCAIYSADGTTLIGVTEEKNVGYLPGGWITFDFIGEPPLIAGNQYILVSWGDSGYTRYDDNTSHDLIGKLNVIYTGIFPSSIADYLENWNITHWRYFSASIYCRYTESVNIDPYPANNSINIQLNPITLNITVSDADGHPMDVSFWTNASGVWKIAQDTNSSVFDGTYYCLNTSWIDSYSTRYWWSVNTSDGFGGWDNDTYCFTTVANSVPVNSNPDPSNGDLNVPLTLQTLSVTVGDADGHPMDITFRTNESGIWRIIGTYTSVGNGIYYCLNTSWIDSYSTKYWWSVNTSDGFGGWDNDTYCFTTVANSVPVNSNPDPSNGELNILKTLQSLGITVSDADGHPMDITFRTNESGIWRIIGTNTSVGNGIYYCLDTSWIDSYSTRYWWRVSTSDGFGGWDNDTYCFTTVANSVPVNSNPDPSNGELNILKTLQSLGITVSDADGHTMDVSFWTNASGVWKIAQDTNTSIADGTYYCLNTSWIDNYSTKYWWSVNTSDEYGGWKNNTYYFTTTANKPPSSPILIQPANASTGITTNPKLEVKVSDPDNDKMNVIFYESSGNQIGIVTNISSGDSASYIWSDRANSKTYNWYVVVNDTIDNITSETWWFTTKTKSFSGGVSGGSSISTGTSLENIAPTAIINGPYHEFKENPISLDGSNSKDTDGIIIKYAWIFGDETTGTGKTITHTYNKIGNYTITLTVTDDGGKTHSNTTYAVITEKPNYPPTADFSYSPLNPKINDTIQFTDLSTDTDGTIISYYWNFGDGINSTNKNPTHTYIINGTHLVTLTIKDNNNATDTISKTIIIGKNNVTDNTNDTTTEETPGFESILIIISISIVLFIKRKKIKIKQK